MAGGARRTASDLPAIDRGRIADRIFHDLKEQIVSGALAEGAQLSTEKALAHHYAVSGSTVREAVRGLSLVGLVDVQHGRGAYVRATGDPLMAMSLGAAIRLEGVGALDMIDVLGVFIEHAAERAVEHATQAELCALQAAALALGSASTIEDAEAHMRAFYRVLVLAAHNPLMGVLCRFLAEVQIELSNRATGRSLRRWRAMLQRLHPHRTAFVNAIVRRDGASIKPLAHALQAEAIKNLDDVPRPGRIGLAGADAELAMILSAASDAIANTQPATAVSWTRA